MKKNLFSISLRCLGVGTNTLNHFYMSNPDSASQYESWLTTVANTRFVFNTMDELETFLETPSIHNNGIKRCFTTEQRIRAAFRDLEVEVGHWTDGDIHLERTLYQYRRAWDFYRSNLSRRSNPRAVAMELLRYSFYPYCREGLNPKKTAIFREIEEKEIKVAFIVLMLLKAVPGYDSKDGDAADMAQQYESVLQFMEEFIVADGAVSVKPAIDLARCQPIKSRVVLFHQVSKILDTYESFSQQQNLYYVSDCLKSSAVNIDIEGFWNECGGEMLYTEFWQIEPTGNCGTFFATHWHKDSRNVLVGIRYSMFLTEMTDGSLMAFMLHPNAISKRMQGQDYGDADQVWFKTEMPKTESPDSISFTRYLSSNFWQQNLNLTRITDEKCIMACRHWLKTCRIDKPFGHLEYEFTPAIHAITTDAVYIESVSGGTYYKVPRNGIEGMGRIGIDDNVGIMTMDGRQYIVFDELMLYIPITPDELDRYGIVEVKAGEIALA